MDRASDASLADAPRGRDCILEGTIRDYRVLDDANLLVSATAERRYHMQLRRRATGLRTSWSIAFSSPTSRICSGFSELLVDDSFGIDRIRIESIRQLTDEEYENLLVRFGVASAKKEQVPAPEPVQGAEAEELD